jgi:hypothetical protein
MTGRRKAALSFVSSLVCVMSCLHRLKAAPLEIVPRCADNPVFRVGRAMPATTDSNLEIAKRANDEARADFATWLMMAKLNSIDALPQDAQAFFAGYRALLARGKTTEAAAADTTIRIVYQSYFLRLGGTGTPPDIKSAPRTRQMPDNHDNVTPFRKIKPNAPPPREKKKLPVALIFIGLIVLAVAWHYLSRGAL